jgi:hypothetical protein
MRNGLRFKRINPRKNSGKNTGKTAKSPALRSNMRMPSLPENRNLVAPA